MKKMLGLIVAALLLCGFAGHAMADFSADQELFRVVYNTSYQASSGQPQAGTGSNEVITDLGNLGTINLSGGPLTVGGGADAFTNFAGFGTGTTTAFSKLQVTYFAIDQGFITGTWSAWVSGSVPLNSGDSGFNGGMTAAVSPTGVANLHMVSANTMEIAQSDSQSFNSSVEAGPSGPGTYQGFINTTNAFDTESNLAALAAGGSVMQVLYAFGLNGTDVTSAMAGIPVINITTNADGSTTLGKYAAPVPIPPSMLLLGTGLLGLIGLRRKGA